MKLKLFIAVSLLPILVPTRLSACLTPVYKAADYLMVRLYDHAGERSADLHENCRLWQILTRNAADTAAIAEVLCQFSAEGLRAATSNRSADTPSGRNSFVGWLSHPENGDARRLLLLAKQCEEVRANRNSPWYYPCEGDDVTTRLCAVRDSSLTCTEGPLLDRYTLQAVRAMFSLSEYGACINLWQERQASLPAGWVRDRIEGYVAGALLRTGEASEALEIFARHEDVESLIFCARQLGFSTRDDAMNRLLYRLNPDSHHLLRHAEQVLLGASADSDRMTQTDYKELRAFADRVLREGRCRNLAPWYYVKACCLDLEGRSREASQVLARGERCAASEFLRASMRVFRLCLNARLLPVDATYDAMLLREMKWLDAKIRNNITPEVRETVINHTKTLSHSSFYYWNDILRKVLAGIAAPRYLAAGKPERALQVTNMADYRLVHLVGYCTTDDEGKPVALERLRTSAPRNALDYTTDWFHMADTISVRSLIAYARRTAHPQSDFDRFVRERGYVSEDLVNELIGTKYLRMERYDKAAEYFRKVPPSYFYRLNTCRTGCMHYDPFDTEHRVKEVADYKYRFAVEMDFLQREMRTAADANRRAMMQLRYVIGLRNSRGKCWALTQYVKSSDEDHYRTNRWYIPPHPRQFDAYCRRLEQQAFALITDRETEAQVHLMMHRYTRLRTEALSATTAGRYVRTHCDTRRDYQER
ncbi:hypothetical protein [Alistipes sp.]|uniref:hypothetical protein n=1 Tax=Alistipes sp. TaxID=1872444 RepID=UPI0025BAF5E8|nr:hypothetical protein [Alistipes sp.]